MKQNPTLVWPFFIPGGPIENSAKRPNCLSAPLSNLTSQIEECDFGLNGNDNEFFIGKLYIECKAFQIILNFKFLHRTN